MSFLDILPPELMGLIVALVGGFVSGAIIGVLPGKVRLVLFLDGRVLERDKPDAEFFSGIETLKYPATFAVVQAILLLATLYGVYYFTSKVEYLMGYILVLNIIFAIVAFSIGLMVALMLLHKASTDAVISKEAYKAIMRKAVASSQVPSKLE